MLFPDVCYYNDNVGCYNKEKPFDHFDYLPNSPGPLGMDVLFQLYTRQNEEKPELLNNALKSTDWSSVYFDPSIKTTFLIHGFNDNGKTPWIMRMKNEILKKVCYFTPEFETIVLIFN